MEDPLTAITNLVSGILSRVGGVKTNEEECQALASMAEQTLRMLESLETKALSDSVVASAMEHVHEALDDANKAIEKCCNAAFLSALLWPESYLLPLRRAVESLDSAVSQICFASVRMTAEIKDEVGALFDQIHRRNLNKRKATAQQTDALKKVIEKGFHEQSQENREVKRLIWELMRGHASNMQEFSNELKLLNKTLSEAKRNKEKQMENELNQIIKAMSESMVEANQDLVLIPNLKVILRCPITNEIMNDPILVKESGRIYDRSSIAKRLQRKHFQDPQTNVELAASNCVRCYALRDVCRALLEHIGDSSTNDEDYGEVSSKTWPASGLYEGHGKISIGSYTVHVFQLLILQPSREVTGCTLYNKEILGIHAKGMEIGHGKWDSQTIELFFGDSYFSYHGKIYCGTTHRQVVLKWKGKASNALVPHKEHAFIFNYSSPHIGRTIMTSPRILEMKSNVVTLRNDVQGISKLLVSLELDFNVGGSMWFESIRHERKTIGRIIGGKWELEGLLTFHVYFSMQNTKLNCLKEPTNYQTTFQVSGHITQSNRQSIPMFSAKFLKTRDKGLLPSDQSLLLLPEDEDILEYLYLREASTHWHHLHQSPLNLFQVTNSTPLTNSSYPYLVCDKVVCQSLSNTTPR